MKTFYENSTDLPARTHLVKYKEGYLVMISYQRITLSVISLSGLNYITIQFQINEKLLYKHKACD